MDNFIVVRGGFPRPTIQTIEPDMMKLIFLMWVLILAAWAASGKKNGEET